MRNASIHPSNAPAAWPSVWGWMGSARSNVLSLFPRETYEKLRVDRWVFGRRVVVLSDPESIAHICGRAHPRYRLSNLHLRLLGPSLGRGLVVAQDREWIVQRKLATRLMPARHALERVERIESRIEATLARWATPPGATPLTLGGDALLNALTELSLDLLSQAVFDHDPPVATARAVEAVNLHRAQVECPDLLDALGLSTRLVSPRMRRAGRVAHSMDGDIEAAIKIAAPRVGHRLPPDKRATFSRDLVVSLISGFESITATTVWMMLVLAFDPDLQSQLLESLGEQDFERVVPDRAKTPSLMEGCIAETLRLYPPLPFIFRTAAADDDTPSGPIRKGTLVCISPWLVHRHERLWDVPERFNPQRHMHDSAELRGFMPFGLGVRRCVGMHVGNHLVRAIVTAMLRRFELGSTALVMPHPNAALSLRPQSGFDIRLSTRAGR